MDRLEQILIEAYATIKANQDSSHEAVDPVLAEAMRKYAIEVARHNLERAANTASLIDPAMNIKCNSGHGFVVDKESILKLEIELI